MHRLRGTGASARRMVFRARRSGRVASVLVVLSAALGGGCGEETVGKEGGGTLTKPAHPAMTDTVARSGSGVSNPHQRGALPPGHPPMGGSTPPGGAPSPAPSGGHDLLANGSTDGGPIKVHGLAMQVPAGWVAQPPQNRMRITQFVLPHAEGDAHDGEIVLSTAFGSLESNVARWEGQFVGGPKAEREVRSVNGMDITVVKIAGTFLYKKAPMAPGPGEERPDYEVAVAIVPLPSGGSQLFVKANGPRATMEKWRASLDEFVGSTRAAE